MRGVTEINAMIPNPFVSTDWALEPADIATAWAVPRVSGVRKADVSAPPVTPPESKASPTKREDVYRIIMMDRK